MMPPAVQTAPTFRRDCTDVFIGHSFGVAFFMG